MKNMNMTHPDILKMERDGYLYEENECDDEEVCAQCGREIPKQYYHVRQRWGLYFCDMDCVKEYYGLEEM